jgi:protein SCO1/2
MPTINQLVKKGRKIQRTEEFGKALIGGPFKLINGENNQSVTEEILLNKWTLLYFGFNFCPDICPQEMEKMSIAYNLMKRTMKEEPERYQNCHELQGIYISIDPKRDTPEEVNAL